MPQTWHFSCIYATQTGAKAYFISGSQNMVSWIDISDVRRRKTYKIQELACQDVFDYI